MLILGDILQTKLFVWLIWVSVAALSSWGEQGLLGSWVVQASHCGGVSGGALAVGVWTSVVAKHGGSGVAAPRPLRTGSIVVAYGLSYSCVGFSWTRNQTCVPCFGRRTLYHWTTREVPQIQCFWEILNTVSFWESPKHSMLNTCQIL